MTVVTETSTSPNTEQIVDALAAGDARKARKVMHDHVIAAGDQLARWYERRSSTVFLG